MQVRGRRLDPRRIVRYLFQELIAPWIQIKRFWLRVYWFFTAPLRIGPMWTTSVVAGLIGVMLTILLFKPPARLLASVEQKPAPVLPPLMFAPTVPEPVEPQPFLNRSLWDGAIDLQGQLNRTRFQIPWDQLQHVTTVSRSTLQSAYNVMQPIPDRWTAARRRVAEAWPTIYRQTAPLWNPTLATATVVPQDQPALYGGAGESHPGLVVTRDLPAEAPPSEPLTYALVVQNRGSELLEQITVSEELSNLDRVEETHPPADVSPTALHWRIDSLRPGQERRLAVTLQPGVDREITARASVRATVAVSSSTTVSAPITAPLTINQSPPVLQETPRLIGPVEPASREEIPKAPNLSVVAVIARTLVVDEELSTEFVVSNTGNGDADGVVLTVRVPEGLEHRDGRLVEHRYAHIPAGTTKRAVFKALARNSTLARIDAVLTLGGAPVADWTTQVQITPKPAAPIATPSSVEPAFKDATTIPTPPNPGEGLSPGRSSIPSGAGRPNAGPQGTLPLNSFGPQKTAPSDFSIPQPRTAPGGFNPSPAAPSNSQPQPAAEDDANFVTVPRRPGAGGVSRWKRTMNAP